MGCTGSSSINETFVDPNDPNANDLSTALKPTKSAEYYVKQCDLYFDSLQSKINPERPNYSRDVVRWEHPPWLLLTGLGRDKTFEVDGEIRKYPCICVNRTHKFFEVQPFGRSRVTFYYGEDDIKEKKNAIHIYEEFTFNDQGEMTFIEAWTDDESETGKLRELDADGWPTNFARLSTQIPGLGNSRGLININSKYFIEAAKSNGSLADFRFRHEHFMAEVANVVASRTLEAIKDKLKKAEAKLKNDI